MNGWANQWLAPSGVCRVRAKVWRTLRRQHRIRTFYLATYGGRAAWRNLRGLRGRIAGHVWYRRTVAL